jgi:hypothetical protein
MLLSAGEAAETQLGAEHVIAQTALSQIVVAAEEHAERTQHEPYLVGVSVFVFLTVLLLATLSFNRDK